MSVPDCEIRRAAATDFDGIRALLDLCGLPASDLAAQILGGFHVAVRDAEIIGVAGLEQAGDAALLRSFAVHSQPARIRSGYPSYRCFHCASSNAIPARALPYSER
ncbi:GNAT family N-acetyltransferase [Paraburkholderia heleia]|uniref:hypothetical protein n=1 Tax=Paraburkholderia heleia TaxID=634127 RepID=UPI000B2E4F72|nr:hypothetical protein [Paraburkholderia heleia]